MSTKRLGPVNPGDRSISPKYRVSDWNALNLKKPDSPDWATAVDIFLDRLRGRFLSPINAIRSHADPDIAEFSGFTILAIDCLIIETLRQFHLGRKETPSPHGAEFAKFFLGSRFFSTDFDTLRKGEIFYSHFRCGILHQAQTKKKSLVRYGEPSMIQLADPTNIEEGLVIDRERFHQALLDEINDYALKIRSPQTPADVALQGAFVDKMKTIAT